MLSTVVSENNLLNVEYSARLSQHACYTHFNLHVNVTVRHEPRMKHRKFITVVFCKMVRAAFIPSSVTVKASAGAHVHEIKTRQTEQQGTPETERRKQDPLAIVNPLVDMTE